MQWHDRYLIGIPEIDREHRRLVACVTEIEQVVAQGGRWSDFHFALEGLVSATMEHFTVEESLMRIQNYPQLDDHIVGHVEFLQHLERLETKSLAGPVTAEDIRFLEPLLAEHFVSDDRHYALYPTRTA